MGLWRTELDISSGVARMFATMGIAPPPLGETGINWGQVDQQAWNNWITPWGYTWATLPSQVIWDNWSEPWGK